MRGNLGTPRHTVKGLRPMTFCPTGRPEGRPFRCGMVHRPVRAPRTVAALAACLLAAAVLGAAPGFADPTPGEGRPTAPPAAAGHVADASAPPPGAGTASTHAPSDLEDLAAWLEYKRNTHRFALQDEARLFYRRGLMAQRAGRPQEATRLVRGAAELDPAFVAPHLTLASWALTRDPSQALLRYAMALELLRKTFLLQIELAANLLFFLLHGLFLGVVATSLVVVCLHQAELRHMWEERLKRRLGPTTSRVWAWMLAVVPFAVGLGIALPTAVFMGMLWPLLKLRERVLFVTLLLSLVAAPFAGHLFGRLAMPLREERGPLYGIASLPDEGWTQARQTSLARLAAAHPDNPYLQFGLGWIARQGRDLATAEAAYRRALELWPQDARVMNNLANVLVAEGRFEPAIDLYRAAMSADPENAAAPFNLSQVYTRQFEYRAASEAAARASALDFELVKTQQALGTEDGVLPTADQWIAPSTFWATVLEPSPAERSRPTVPPAWQGRLETSGLPFAAAVLLLAIAAAVTGSDWQRAMPLRPCRNCGRVVCRRCSQRRREMALCPTCAEMEGQAESPEFAKVLLARSRGRRERGQRLVRTVLAALLPGFGLLSYHRVFRATLLITATVLLTAPWLGVEPPFSYHSWPGLGGGTVPVFVLLAVVLAIYGNSLLGYLAQSSRAEAEQAALAAPVRSRPSTSGRITAKAA